MGLIAVGYTAPPSLSNLVAASSATGVRLHWDMPIDSIIWATEIWYSAINDRASATVLATVVGVNNYTHNKLGNGLISYYYWIRAVGVNKQTNGAWFPLNSIAGISGTVGLIQTLDINPGSVSTTSFGNALGPASVITAVDTSTYIGVLGFTLTNSSPNSLPFTLSHLCKQTYASTYKITAWKMTKFNGFGYVSVQDYGNYAEVNEMPSISYVHTVPPGETHMMGLFWMGEDPSISIQDRSFYYLGIKV